jgi:hypothetical protein
MLALAAVAWLAVAPVRADSLEPPSGDFPVTVVETETTDEWTETTLKFPSPVKSPWPANDVVWAHLVVPKSAVGKRSPAVLVLPVMAAPNVWIETRFVNRFVRDGLVVMWLEMPTQFHRRPDPSEPSGQVFLARTPKRLAANFRQSILDARRAVGLLAARPEVDAGKIGVFGISLGAIVASTVYSLDDRPRYGMFLLGGADFPSLLMASSLTGPFARKMGIKPDELALAWKGLDPLERTERNRLKPALLINAWSDWVIPRANGRRLSDAFPAARQIWVPLGHYSAILHLVWLPTYASARMREGLAR